MGNDNTHINMPNSYEEMDMFNSNYQILEQGGMDKRARRLMHRKLYEKTVDQYRARPAPASKSGKKDNFNAKVFVRARPLFEHEYERGEWECVSSYPADVVVHDGTEKFGCGGGKKMLIHHRFPGLESIADDTEGYSKLQYLVEGAAQGKMATLFMYGMTGSGKTYSTNLVHEGCATDLLQGGVGVELIAYELIGKCAFDLLSEDKREVHIRIGEDGATHVHGSTVQCTSDPSELTTMLKDAAGMRETSATGTNASSSRSHAVYQLRLSSGGSLTLIDLAGNEGNTETFHHSREQMTQ